MDDLDRMFRRLVHNIRNGYPEYLTRPFEVAELYQTLIPYRHNRRELGMETAQDYELVLCQLLAGERGFLIGDDIMQEAVGRELAASNPNTAIFREFAATRVALSPEALRRYDQLMASTSPASTATISAASPTGPASAMGNRAAPSAFRTPSPPGPTAPSLGPSAQPGAEAVDVDTAPYRATTADAADGRGTCRYCGGALPVGRRAVFCPHCGQNLTVQRCPACSTELELDWKFCITCGRDASLA